MRKKLMLDTVKLSAFLLAAGVAVPSHAESSGQYIDDAAISTKVRAAFIGDSALNGSNISVETDKASVYLTGLVSSKGQEDEAVRVAGQVDGVKNVLDYVTVRGQQEP